MMLRSLYAVVAAVAVFTVVGCSKEEAKSGGSVAVVVPTSGGHDHGGWWCPEHGMPEEICAQCSSKVAAELKAKGDWCAEHNVPLSQCFVHTPDAQAKFAALYEAKYGKAPPPLE